MAGAKIWPTLVQIQPCIINPILGIWKLCYYSAEFMVNTMRQRTQLIILKANEATSTENACNGKRMFLF